MAKHYRHNMLWPGPQEKSMNIRSVLPLIVLVTTITSAQTYSVTDLGTLGGNATEAHAINGVGQVTGSSNLNTSTSHAFLYSGGRLIDIGSLGGSSALGLGINTSGQIAGYSTQADGSYRGFLYSNGVMTALPTLSGNYGTAYGINNSGQIVGNGVTASGIQAGVLIQNGTVTDIGNLGGVDGTYANAINNLGQIVGLSYNAQGNFLAFLWQNGTMTSLGTLGGQWSQAYGINDSGQVTGTAYLKGNTGPHAFLFSHGKMIDLDGRSSILQSWGFGINGGGVVVGHMQLRNGQVHAMAVLNQRMQDLNKLIPSGSGWVLEEAYAINDAGQIVGYGAFQGKTRGFLLTPQ
jgi:probable HAF family extracellular repeat protein